MKLGKALRKHKWKVFFIIVGILLIGVVTLIAEHRMTPLSWGFFHPYNIPYSGIALDGYDSVSYHLEGEAKKGDPNISLEWMGNTWYFRSLEHRALFQENPEKYAPKFGANCARAVQYGFTTIADPEVWFIQDEQLYVFYSEGPKKDWVNDIPNGAIAQTEKQWNEKRLAGNP